MRMFAERQAINAPIQGSAADVIRRAMIRMPEAIAKANLNARMLLQVHDELVFEVPEAQADQLIALTQDVMMNACRPALELSVPLVVDAKAGATWGEAH
jgi:DNA polymerase-1